MFGLLLGFKRLGQCLARCFKKDEVKALLIIILKKWPILILFTLVL